MSEIGERAHGILGRIRDGAGSELHSLLDELAGLVRKLDEHQDAPASGFTQASEVESDPDSRHNPGSPSGQS